jgi:hypothetical protein
MVAEAILDLYFSLQKPTNLPKGVEAIFPFDNAETKRVMELFYRKYYSDENPRTLLFGINPGRHGAGLTGVGFTDPILMEEKCGIANDLPRQSELSAGFICEVVEAYGGPERFYGEFLFTTVLPYGLLKNGKNYNYYDDKETLASFEPIIIDAIKKQMAYPNVSRTIATIGQGKNLDILKKLNKRYGFFDRIEVLPHPRWVMQYRRREKEKYIHQYVEKLAILHKRCTQEEL